MISPLVAPGHSSGVRKLRGILWMHARCAQTGPKQGSNRSEMAFSDLFSHVLVELRRLRWPCG